MCRRLSTILMLPALLLTQWVSAARCTGGCRTVGHDIGPHVHLGEVVPAQNQKPSCGCKQQAQVAPQSDNARTTSAVITTHDTPERSPGDGGVLYLPLNLGLAIPSEPGNDAAKCNLNFVGGPARAGLTGCRRVGQDARPHPSPPTHTLPVFLRTLRLIV